MNNRIYGTLTRSLMLAVIIIRSSLQFKFTKVSSRIRNLFLTPPNKYLYWVRTKYLEVTWMTWPGLRYAQVRTVIYSYESHSESVFGTQNGFFSIIKFNQRAAHGFSSIFKRISCQKKVYPHSEWNSQFQMSVHGCTTMWKWN